ncbi:MAG: protein translocase subunit SecF [Holosporales bacterium]|jgi:preprotein translocase SecF subunit|nr:protein translocase subunit SecF [Holosporales bacterium]
MGIRFIPNDVNINFMRYKGFVFCISAALVLLSVFSVIIKGINYGIDFKGGYVIEARFPSSPNLGQLREKLGASYSGDFTLQQLGTDGKDIVIRLERNDKKVANDDIEKEQAAVVEKVKETLGNNVSYRKIETIGPTIGKELVQNAIKAVILALLAMAIYIAFRFEWQFALCGLIVLAQDCICLLGMYALFKIEFNATSIVAILTTASYSINDAIVIFDRVRENIKRYKKMHLNELINKSINETLSRTIFTAGTTLLAILALCFFGGEVIRAFSLPIFAGIAFGTFSSIAVSAPLLAFFKIDSEKIAGKKEKKVSEN